LLSCMFPLCFRKHKGNIENSLMFPLGSMTCFWPFLTLGDRPSWPTRPCMVRGGSKGRGGCREGHFWKFLEFFWIVGKNWLFWHILAFCIYFFCIFLLFWKNGALTWLLKLLFKNFLEFFGICLIIYRFLIRT
jgi:hypothetical protein